MKPPLTAINVLSLLSEAVPTADAKTRSPAVYGYCVGCTEWTKYEDKSLLPAVVKTAASAATHRSTFIPWPTAATRLPIFKEMNLWEVDFNVHPLVSSNPAPQGQLPESDLPKQQYEEESFMLLLLLVVAIVLASGEKQDKLSSSNSDEDEFDMLELAPTVDNEEDEKEDESEMRTICKSLFVGSISSEGKCVVNEPKTEKRVTFQVDKPFPEEDAIFYSPNLKGQYHDCKSSIPSPYTCNDTFQDKVSVEILKILLENRVDKYDTSAAMPYFPYAAAEKEEEQQPQDRAEADILSTTLKESDENESNDSFDLRMNEYEDFLFQIKHSLH